MKQLGYEFENDKGLIIDAGARSPKPIKDAKGNTLTRADLAQLAPAYFEKEYEKHKADQYGEVILRLLTNVAADASKFSDLLKSIIGGAIKVVDTPKLKL